MVVQFLACHHTHTLFCRTIILFNSVQYAVMYWNLKICRNPQKSKGASGLSLPSSPPSYSSTIVLIYTQR
jgi:hypothetical protein